ncbi:MAG: diguanylate cyclase (GGDEF)-like protein [Parasphingorhabdus sp.]|jgi:diguanylate cyclase (GGDEF)-like protein
MAVTNGNGQLIRSQASSRPAMLFGWSLLLIALCTTAILVWLSRESLLNTHGPTVVELQQQSTNISQLNSDLQVIGKAIMVERINSSANFELANSIRQARSRIKELSEKHELSKVDASRLTRHSLNLSNKQVSRLEQLIAGSSKISDDDYDQLSTLTETLQNLFVESRYQTQLAIQRQSSQLDNLRLFIRIYFAVLLVFTIGVVSLLIRRRSSETRLSMMRQRLVESIETIREGFVLFDQKDQLILCNGRFRQLFPKEVQDNLYKMPYPDLAFSLIQHDTYSVSGFYFRERLEKFVNWHQAPQGVFELEHASGLVFQISEYTTPSGDTVGIYHDVTDLMEAHKKLEHLAQHDHVTGLFSRAYFENLIPASLEKHHRCGWPAALIFIDLDRFKIINDSFGHPTGDVVLNHVAGALRKYSSVKNVFSRYGGDEFALFVSNLNFEDNPQSVARVLAENILKSVSGNISVGPAEAYITASIGIAIFPEHGHNLKTLIQSADTAAYYAKSLGGSNVQVFSNEMQLAAHRKVDLERHLRMALNHREMYMEFQPQIDLRSGRISGFEALARWNSKALGQVSPSEFIPLAEETGLIFPISNWILREVCRHIAAWRANNIPTVPVSINLSARQFRDKNLNMRISGTLSEFNLEPQAIIVEVTETTVLENIETATETLNWLTDLGIKLAIDDFGTDYSSMSAIKRFPVNIIKIDYSFIHDMEDDPDTLQIVIAIITMAKNIGITVVAEGVENERQLSLLQARDCDVVQGYFFSKAVPANDVPVLISRNTTKPLQLSRVE